MSEPDRHEEEQNHTFTALSQLYSRWKDGTFSEIIEDWKWIYILSQGLHPLRHFVEQESIF